MINQSLTSSVDEVKVVIEQTLLKVEEVFVYRIPPCPTSGGHRADDWNLANPQATCSLIVLHRDNALLIRLLADQPKKGGPPGAKEQHLFAQCKVQLDLSANDNASRGTSISPQHPKPKMDYWVEPVVDSSRYFAIRISDETSKREAHVGIGFRERNDALSFKMSLQEYENTMRKEALVQENRMSHTVSESPSLFSASTDRSSELPFDSITAVSKLSLKESEKIHVNFKGMGRSRVKKIQQDVALKPPIFLRKPPPPASPPPATAAVVVNTDVITTSRTGLSQDMSSVVALAETMDTDDDDEWGDFESVPSSGI